MGSVYNLNSVKQLQRNCASPCGNESYNLHGDVVDIAGYYARFIQEKDDLTGRHSLKVAALMAGFARYIGLSADKVFLAYVAGLLHDLGKVCIAKDILAKPAQLTIPEFLQMRQHPVMGADILGKIKGFSIIACVVRHHHEQYDGTGYPDRLSGADIPYLSRMLALCDSFDAMTSLRHYRSIYTTDKALDEIEHGKGGQFDPGLSQLFINYIMEKGTY